MKIEITKQAEEHLKEIYLYYKKEVSIVVAKKIRDSVFERIKILKNHLNAGPIDEHLKSLGLGHRKLTEGNYKIVYRVVKEVVYITDIFDARQDPDKQKP